VCGVDERRRRAERQLHGTEHPARTTGRLLIAGSVTRSNDYQVVPLGLSPDGSSSGGTNWATTQRGSSTRSAAVDADGNLTITAGWGGWTGLVEPRFRLPRSGDLDPPVRSNRACESARFPWSRTALAPFLSVVDDESNLTAQTNWTLEVPHATQQTGSRYA